MISAITGFCLFLTKKEKRLKFDYKCNRSGRMVV